MRAACCGAMSARSWITILPLVVSITIAFFLSRLAGSDCASAGAAKASAARKASRRIMETPDGSGDGNSPGRGLAQTRDNFYEGKWLRPFDMPAVIFTLTRPSGSCLLFRELGFQEGCNGGRHEGRHVAAHASDLTHQCGGDRADRHRGRDEDGMDVGRHRLVHAGDLHLVVEIGAVAQAPDHEGRPPFSASATVRLSEGMGSR